MNAATVLQSRYPADVIEALLDSYKEIESNFVVKKWKASELDAGHFVENVRRLLELELTGSATPLTSPLSKFTDQVLKQYENAKGDESFRILIPRALKAVYNIRNKRGVGHVAGVSPNQMDATYILYTVKWVLAELVRLSSGLSVTETQRLVDEIVQRRLEVLWKHQDITKILDTRIKTKEQILVLLYDQSPQSEAVLRQTTEYKNQSKFRAILRVLHRTKSIHYIIDSNCLLTPKGLIEAEAILQKAGAG
jgi:hypothetical protein